MSMNNSKRRVHIELNRRFLSWCHSNSLIVKENNEVFFVNERLLMKPEYIINGNTYVDVLKSGEFKLENINYYQDFANSFGNLILIREEYILELDEITKEDLMKKHNINF
jgi:hypothetical protein